MRAVVRPKAPSSIARSTRARIWSSSAAVALRSSLPMTKSRTVPAQPSEVFPQGIPLVIELDIALALLSVPFHALIDRAHGELAEHFQRDALSNRALGLAVRNERRFRVVEH